MIGYAIGTLFLVLMGALVISTWRESLEDQDE